VFHPSLVDIWRQQPRDIDQTYVQPFAKDNLGGGLAVGMCIRAAANWEADDVAALQREQGDPAQASAG